MKKENQKVKPVVISNEVTEGRLLAHRNVLAMIIAELVARGGGRDLLSALDSACVAQDHAEDPLVLAGASTVVQGALAEEVTTILRSIPAGVGV